MTLVFLVILLVWILESQGGLSFDGSSAFGFHALLMSLLVVVFMQEAILIFKVPLLPLGRRFQTMAHISCHFMSLVCAVSGMVAIVYYKQLAPQKNGVGNQYFPYFTLYSGHSWLGIMFMGLYALQALLRLVTKNRDVHDFLGSVLYALGLAVCALGLQGMQSSDLGTVHDHEEKMVNTTENDPMGQNVGIVLNHSIAASPTSSYSQYSAAMVILLAFNGLAVFTVKRFLVK